MTIYLIVFACSILFIYFSEYTYNRQLRGICVSIGILIPAILAGCRDASIGVDVSVYGKPFFERAVQSTSIFIFFSKQALLGHIDMGFNAIVYIVSRFAKDYHWSLFVYELITVAVIYWGYKRCNLIYGTPVWLGVLLYYLSLYNASFNILRQTIAVSFVFVACTYIFTKEYKKYIVLMVIAFSVHSSSIIGGAVFPMYSILQIKEGDINERKQLHRGMMIIAVVMVIVVGANQIIQVLVNTGIFRENYLRYLQGGSYSKVTEGRSVSVAVLGIQLIYMLILFLHYRRINRRNMQGMFYLMISGLILLITCFGPLFAEYISRLSYYIVPLQMVGLTNTSNCYKKGISKNVWMAILIVILFATWMRTYVILGYHATVPYQAFWR